MAVDAEQWTRLTGSNLCDDVSRAVQTQAINGKIHPLLWYGQGLFKHKQLMPRTAHLSLEPI